MKKLTKEQQELCEQYMPLVTYCLRKRFHNGCPRSMRDDLKSECYLALARAAVHYDANNPRKASFCTYAFTAIYRQIGRYLEQQAAQPQAVGNIGFNAWTTSMTKVLEVIRHDAGYITEQRPFEYVDEVNLLLKGLSVSDLDVIKKSIGYDGPPMTLKEIGKQLGVSRQRIHQRYHHAMKRIKENYSSRPF